MVYSEKTSVSSKVALMLPVLFLVSLDTQAQNKNQWSFPAGKLNPCAPTGMSNEQVAQQAAELNKKLRSLGARIEEISQLKTKLEKKLQAQIGIANNLALKIGAASNRNQAAKAKFEASPNRCWSAEEDKNRLIYFKKKIIDRLVFYYYVFEDLNVSEYLSKKTYQQTADIYSDANLNNMINERDIAIAAWEKKKPIDTKIYELRADLKDLYIEKRKLKTELDKSIKRMKGLMFGCGGTQKK